MQQHGVYVNVFGELTFKKNDLVFKPTDVLSKNLIHLLEFLICHRHQVIAKEQLIDTLWPNTNNPESALKFSVHRLRSLIEKESFFGDQLVITKKNGYSINPLISMTCDLEKADQLLSMSKQKDISIKQKMEILGQLIDIIDKPFLQNSVDVMWCHSIREYYKSTYNASAIQLMQYAHEQSEFNQLVIIAQKATQVDPLYEDHHYYYLIGLISLKRYRDAIEYYQWLIGHFHKEVQTSLSPKVKDLYTFIIKQEQINHVNMNQLMNELDDFQSEGSYYCDYEVFKRYYQIAKRSSERDHASYYVVLFEIPDSFSHQQSNTIMEDLIFAIQSSLRKGDVFTRMNPKQCVILIPCEACNNIDNIVNRVKKNYKSNAEIPLITLKHHITQLSKKI